MIHIPGTALIDFESRSRCSLKKRGGRNYWVDPSTEAICAVLYDVDSGEVYTWRPGDAPPVLGVAVAQGVPAVVAGEQRERTIFTRLRGVTTVARDEETVVEAERVFKELGGAG